MVCQIAPAAYVSGRPGCVARCDAEITPVEPDPVRTGVGSRNVGITALLFTLASGVARTQPAPASRQDSVRRDSAATLEAVTATAIRARNEAPISSTTLKLADIERRSFGQDVPLLLQGTPS